MNIVDKKPVLATGAWVAPSAAVIGNVSLGSESSVWYNSVVKGVPYSWQQLMPAMLLPDNVPLLVKSLHTPPVCWALIEIPGCIFWRR